MARGGGDGDSESVAVHRCVFSLSFVYMHTASAVVSFNGVANGFEVIACAVVGVCRLFFVRFVIRRGKLT